MDNIYTLGIDIGSTASKCVMLRDGKEIVSKSLISVGAGTSGPQRAIAEVLESAGMTREQMAYVLATTPSSTSAARTSRSCRWKTA